MIRALDVCKSFGPHKVLDGVTLEVKPGELTVLTGASGSGKSTFLRCLNGLETFDSGTIVVGDLTMTGGTETAANLLALRRRVGMVFQQFNLFPHLSALENVMVGPRRALGLSKAESAKRAAELLAKVGLADKHASKPGQLSGGQQQRVAIARALAVEPQAVLFDEPTSALDPAMAAEVVATIRALAKDGQTMVVVTHDEALAREAAVVHRMAAGRLLSPSPLGERG